MTRSPDPRGHDLLADRALFGLDSAEAGELQALGADADDSYDLAAAAVELATLAIEPMPAAVAERIAAARHPRTLAGWQMSGPLPQASPQSTAMPPTPMPHTATPPAAMPSTGMPMPHAAMPIPHAGMATPATVAPRTRRRRPAAATWIAAAATLAVVAGAWWLLRGRAAPSAPTAAEARAELLASASDATRLAWKATPEAASASGDVVWSQSAQRGFMRFVGLPANDPAKAQYQLWIFDRARDQAFPVDGGVFDVTATGEVIVPITAKLRVDDATLFAVTVERPGGVVVSRREHIVVTAARS